MAFVPYFMPGIVSGVYYDVKLLLSIRVVCRFSEINLFLL